MEHLVKEFNKNQQYQELADINPELVSGRSDKQRALRNYFNSSEKYNMVMDKVPLICPMRQPRVYAWMIGQVRFLRE